MKNTNTAKKQTSQMTSAKNLSSHIKIVKPQPSSNNESSVQGPRDCFPLG